MVSLSEIAGYNSMGSDQLSGIATICNLIAQGQRRRLSARLFFQRSPPPILERTEQGRLDQERRSTRVALKVVIAAQGVSEPLNCDGETIVVNRHGALIWTSVPLRVEMKIEIHVILTDKRARAKVVYVDPERPRVCGIGLAEPENIWGLSLPPNDWQEDMP